MRSRIGETVAPSSEAVLSRARVAAFHRDGYLALPSFVPPAELDRVAALVAPLLDDPATAADGMRFDYLAPHGQSGAPRVLQLLLPFDYEPRLFDTALFTRSVAVATQLLGRQLRYRGSHYVEKPPAPDNPTAMHQDEAFWEPAHRHEAIAVWLPFDAVDDASSCLKFVPGSHAAEGLRPHRRLGGDPRVHGLELHPPLDEEPIVACPLPRGGATVHHCRTVHGSGPNRGSAPRRALVLNLEAPPRPLTTPRSVPWQAASVNTLDARRRERDIDLP